MFNRYYDDGSKARERPQRHYAFREGSPPLVSENRWETFLNYWNSDDLASATNLVCAHVVADLTMNEQDLLCNLRQFADVLLLDKQDPLHVYQTRLRSLNRLGILNLSLSSSDASLSQLLARKRSLEASLREAKKRNRRHMKTIEKMHLTTANLEEQLQSKDRLLAHAQAKFMEYKTMHPDWKPVYHDLQDVDHEDAKKIFEVVDKDVDIDAQMRYDPSGTLACFWADQRKQLSRDGRAKRWNPRVSSFVLHMYYYVHPSCVCDACRFSGTAFFCGWRLETQSSIAYVTCWFFRHAGLSNCSRRKSPMGTVIARMCSMHLVYSLVVM